MSDQAPAAAPDSALDGAAKARSAEGNRLIYLGVGAFVGTCILMALFGSRMGPPTKTEPGYPLTEVAIPMPDGSFRITVDSSDREAWVAVDLGTGRRLESASGADLLIKRHYLRAPGGTQDLGTTKLSTAKALLAPFIPDTRIDGELRNVPISEWYNYSYFTHLLRTRDHTYAVRRVQDRGVAYVRVESYYCQPEGSGCLTLRYRLADLPKLPEGGSRRSYRNLKKGE